MSAIAGFYNSKKYVFESEQLCKSRLEQMSKAMHRRNFGQSADFLAEYCGFTAGPASTGAQSDYAAGSALEDGQPDYIFGSASEDGQPDYTFGSASEGGQPVCRRQDGHIFMAVCDGEIYNQSELGFSCKNQISGLLDSYISQGIDFLKKVNGVFSAAIYDGPARRLLLIRDRLGVKPLFWAMAGETLVFGSEIKALFTWPGLQPELDRQGLNEVFSIGPARTGGCGVFHGVHEVLPGHCLVITPDGIRDHSYWKLKSRTHEDDYETTVAKTRELLIDAVMRQMEGKVSLCSFLSGGVDSSLVSAICAREMKQQGERLTTYSFDFTDSEKYFKANAFQPSLDAPFVEKMVQFLDSDHHVLTCTTNEQTEALKTSVLAHDLPNMADVDSSLLCFCKEVGKHHGIALTGECADEIFNGYPWYHKEECLYADTFPWTMDLNARKTLLSDEFVNELKMDEYVAETYQRSIDETPICEEDSERKIRQRRISYLNLKWFMQTLLNRMDRDAAHSGLTARVPFADYRIVEYLYNVPWEMKAHGGIVKGLLRDAGKGLVPDEILFRRKSPYPKTYDTGYEALLIERVREMMADSSAPVLPFLDKKKVELFLTSPSDYGKPWYGQLMAAPQLLAYLLQVNFWLRNYHVKLL